MNPKSTILIAAAVATASALTETQDEQLNIIFADVGEYIDQYIALVSDSSSGITMDNLPSGLIDIGEEVATNPDDTSYTTLYTEVDMAAVSSFVTKLSWYSSRIEPALESAGVAIGGSSVDTTTAAATTDAATTDAATTAAATTAAATTAAATTAAATTAAATTAAATTAAATTAAATTAADTTSTTADTTSTTAATTSISQKETTTISGKSSTSNKSTVAAISQITDGQIQATATVEQQTGNAANLNSLNMGVGAGALAAVALLL